MPSGDSLQSKVAQWLELKRDGTNINDRLRSSKGFRNPDFLQSVVEHFSIDQHGTLFSPDVFDPKGYSPQDFYDELAKAQRRENERREKERRERGLDRGLEFASGGHVGGSIPGGGGAAGGGVNKAAAVAAPGLGAEAGLGNVLALQQHRLQHQHHQQQQQQHHAATGSIVPPSQIQAVIDAYRDRPRMHEEALKRVQNAARGVGGGGGGGAGL